MRRVHIVDDDPEIRDLLQQFLKGGGYAASTSEDGDAALAWLAENEADIVLLDLCMPGLSGMELLRRINELYASVPVIVISGHADEESARQALKSGAYDFFLKPFDLESVESHLRMKLEMMDSAEESRP